MPSVTADVNIHKIGGMCPSEKVRFSKSGELPDHLPKIIKYTANMDKKTFERAIELNEQLATLKKLQGKMADFRTFIQSNHYDDCQWHRIIEFLKNQPKEFYCYMITACQSGICNYEKRNQEDIDRIEKEIAEL